MVMMEQYKQETAQIHAPAELIRRTKQAMQLEEQRLQREGTVERAAVYADRQGGKKAQQTDKSAHLRSGRIYRWALPAAAAVMAVVLIYAAAPMIGSRFRKSYSGAPMESAMDEAPAEYEEAAAADASEAGAVVEAEGADTGGMAAGTQESWNRTMTNQSADLYASKQTEAGLYDDGDPMAAWASADEAAEACEEDGVLDEAAEGIMEKTGSDRVGDSTASGKASDLTVTEVAKAPSFVNDEGTECIMVSGIGVYVTRQADGQWTAFARIGQANYMVTGGADVNDAEEFAVEAYECITETAENK